MATEPEDAFCDCGEVATHEGMCESCFLDYREEAAEWEQNQDWE